MTQIDTYDQSDHPLKMPELIMNVSSLDDVRSNIDRLDREIIRLIAERGTYVHQAAKFKTSSAEVEAPKRVEQVIAKVRAISEEAGLKPSVAEAAYRAMISAFIEVEHKAFEGHQTSTG